ncbi:MAG: hypothetical protein KatS3mg035_1063 [Bacteroidia bacterium]|nr:MAG: hypothetical protein KatS3mg035_1063 [Bacteroidia bacterium]
MNKAFTITLINERDTSHNINMSMPIYFCFAQNKEEAIGKMMLSDFSYKHLPIYTIHDGNEYVFKSAERIKYENQFLFLASKI